MSCSAVHQSCQIKKTDAPTEKSFRSPGEIGRFFFFFVIDAAAAAAAAAVDWPAEATHFQAIRRNVHEKIRKVLSA